MKPDPGLLLAALEEMLPADAADTPRLTHVCSLLRGGDLAAARRGVQRLLGDGDAQALSELWGCRVAPAPTLRRVARRDAVKGGLRALGLVR